MSVVRQEARRARHTYMCMCAHPRSIRSDSGTVRQHTIRPRITRRRARAVRRVLHPSPRQDVVAWRAAMRERERDAAQSAHASAHIIRMLVARHRWCNVHSWMRAHERGRSAHCTFQVVLILATCHLPMERLTTVTSCTSCTSGSARGEGLREGQGKRLLASRSHARAHRHTTRPERRARPRVHAPGPAERPCPLSPSLM